MDLDHHGRAITVISGEEKLRRYKVAELDDGFVLNGDRGKRVGLDPILKNAEESNVVLAVSTNDAVSSS